MVNIDYGQLGLEEANVVAYKAHWWPNRCLAARDWPWAKKKIGLVKGDGLVWLHRSTCAVLSSTCRVVRLGFGRGVLGSRPVPPAPEELAAAGAVVGTDRDTGQVLAALADREQA